MLDQGRGRNRVERIEAGERKRVGRKQKEIGRTRKQVLRRQNGGERKEGQRRGER